MRQSHLSLSLSFRLWIPRVRGQPHKFSFFIQHDSLCPPPWAAVLHVVLDDVNPSLSQLGHTSIHDTKHTHHKGRYIHREKNKIIEITQYKVMEHYTAGTVRNRLVSDNRLNLQGDDISRQWIAYTRLLCQWTFNGRYRLLSVDLISSWCVCLLCLSAVLGISYVNSLLTTCMTVIVVYSLAAHSTSEMTLFYVDLDVKPSLFIQSTDQWWLYTCLVSFGTVLSGPSPNVTARCTNFILVDMAAWLSVK